MHTETTTASKPELIRARAALREFLRQVPPSTLTLDIGAGRSEPHTTRLRDQGYEVHTNDFYADADYVGPFVDVKFDGTYEAVWCSHVLEHQPNVNLFLRKVFDVLNRDGLLAITVPPLKHEIVGGHLTVWNLGLLYYNLIVAGFDCSRAVHHQDGYDISVILSKRAINRMPKLNYDRGDIELLAPYFPFPVHQGFHGRAIPNTF